MWKYLVGGIFLGQLFEIVINYIDSWGYIAIIIGMALESACIPIPSELIFGFTGYLVFLGRMDFTLAVVSGVVGGLLGSVLAYGVGYCGGAAFVERYGRYILLSKKHVAVAQHWFDRYGLKAVFYSRLLPVVRTFISLPAGFAQVNFGKFIVYTALGSLPWTMVLIYAGIMLGENWPKINEVGHDISLIVVIILIGLGVYYLVRSRADERRG